MNATEAAQAIRHISGELAGGGDAATAVKQMHELAETIDPGSGAKLEAYYLEEDSVSERIDSHTEDGIVIRCPDCGAHMDGDRLHVQCPNCGAYLVRRANLEEEPMATTTLEQADGMTQRRVRILREVHLMTTLEPGALMDMLDAKDNRIAELEAQLEIVQQTSAHLINYQRARIAELEAYNVDCDEDSP